MPRLLTWSAFTEGQNMICFVSFADSNALVETSFLKHVLATGYDTNAPTPDLERLYRGPKHDIFCFV